MAPASVVLLLALGFLGCSTAQQTVYTAKLTAIAGATPSAVTGEVTVFQEAGTSVSFAGSASGLEDGITCDGSQANGCGVHVHSGTDCTDSTSQGGHFKGGATDPWTSIMYQSTTGTSADFSGSVADSMGSVSGKAFVVHNLAGERVACGLLVAVTSGVDYAVLAAFGTGGVTVTGKVTTYTSPSAVLVAGSVTGNDCDGAACGAHVHAGTDCTSSDTQGGHYHAVTTDPWVATTWSATGGMFVQKAVAGVRSVSGKAFVVHNLAGDRVTCGVLTSTTKYHMFKAQQTVYTATLEALETSGVTGEVTVFQESGKSVSFIGSAKGLENSLWCDGSKGNGCGVHVHSGTACTDTTSQGGHFKGGTVDPWASIMYSITSATGAADFSGSIADSMGSVAGKAFVVHNFAGGRVACGLLTAVTSGVDYADLAALETSGVTGTVTTYTTSSDVLAVGSAKGLEVSLVAASTSGNACTEGNGCGVHVHSGTGCATKTAQGGHYYEGATDVWAPVGYTSTDSLGVGMFVIKAAAGVASVSTKAFIVHNNAGGRVACGVLSNNEDQSALISTAHSSVAGMAQLALMAFFCMIA